MNRNVEICTFEEPFQTDGAYSKIKQLGKADILKLKQLAIIEKDLINAKFSINEQNDTKE